MNKTLKLKQKFLLRILVHISLLRIQPVWTGKLCFLWTDEKESPGKLLTSIQFSASVTSTSFTESAFKNFESTYLKGLSFTNCNLLLL